LHISEVDFCWVYNLLCNCLLPLERYGFETGTAENVLTAKEVAYTDHGALILSPKVGLHENVGELDFKSLFPSIVVKHNISYETVSASGVHSTGMLRQGISHVHEPSASQGSTVHSRSRRSYSLDTHR